MTAHFPPPSAPYTSPYLRRLFLTEQAAARARRYDAVVIHYINMGFDLASARDMADTTVRYDWQPELQTEHQQDRDRNEDEREWCKG